MHNIHYNEGSQGLCGWSNPYKCLYVKQDAYMPYCCKVPLKLLKPRSFLSLYFSTMVHTLPHTDSLPKSLTTTQLGIDPLFVWRGRCLTTELSVDYRLFYLWLHFLFSYSVMSKDQVRMGSSSWAGTFPHSLYLFYVGNIYLPFPKEKAQVRT